MVCSRLYSAWAQEEEICGCFIRTSEGSVRRICSGGEITRRKLILLVFASLVLAVYGSAYRRSSPQSSEPQKVSMDGYGWTTFGPTGPTWISASTSFGTCVPVACSVGHARADL